MPDRRSTAHPGNRQSADAHECARASVPRAEVNNRKPKATATEPSIKRVVAVSLDTLKETELARFRFRADRVEAEYRSEAYFQDLERGGIVAYDRVVFPSDGRVFFDALDIAHSHSTLVYVETVADPDRDDTDGVRECAESNAADGAWR